MENDKDINTFEEIWKSHVRICELSLAQLIRLHQWKENGVLIDEQELLVGENSEVLSSLYKLREKRKQEILSLDQRIRKEKERDKRNREIDAARRKKK